MDEVRILSLDIETRPNLAYVWSLWDQNVALNQLVDVSEVICFAAKWYGHPKIEFYSVHGVGKETMVKEAYRLLDECDVVMGFNSRSFDLPRLNQEFLLAGMTPPSPYKQIDLFRACKTAFAFPSNKLEYISKALGLKGKVRHEGFDLWVRCMQGDEHAWRTMERYNRRDVVLTEQLYEKIKPWIPNHPSIAAMKGEDVCPTCGSEGMRRGITYTAQSAFQLYQCRNTECARYYRATRREWGVSVREVAV
jgi:DNA polymerase elongation subunit (family B)